MCKNNVTDPAIDRGTTGAIDLDKLRQQVQQMEQSARNTQVQQVEQRVHDECLPSQPTLETVYSLGEVLGEGEFGVVRLATHIETGNLVAIKTVKNADFISEEVRLQQMIDHKGVVKILDVIKEGGLVHIVQDHMAKGSLLDLLISGVRLTESQVRKYFLQVIDAVEACHAANIAHRDLKAENILLDGYDNAKLADFGLAAEMVPGRLLSGCCGSLNYAAPELWKKGAQYHGQGADVWSCGVVLYALLTGNMAYDAEDIPSLVRKITSANYKVSSKTSQGANDLLAKMFAVKPSCRISIQEIREHQWISCA